MTPFLEGRAAGYRDAPSANPYRKGDPMYWTADMIVWGAEYEAGYLEGRALAHDDLVARRLEACR